MTRNVDERVRDMQKYKFFKILALMLALMLTAGCISPSCADIFSITAYAAEGGTGGTGGDLKAERDNEGAENVSDDIDFNNIENIDTSFAYQVKLATNYASRMNGASLPIGGTVYPGDLKMNNVAPFFGYTDGEINTDILLSPSSTGSEKSSASSVAYSRQKLYEYQAQDSEIKTTGDVPGIWGYANYGLMLNLMGFDTVGASKTETQRPVFGIIAMASYYAASSVNMLFEMMFDALEASNPFQFFKEINTTGSAEGELNSISSKAESAVNGSKGGDYAGTFGELTKFFSDIYNTFTDFAWAVTVPLALIFILVAFFLTRNGRYRFAGNIKKFFIRVVFLLLGIPILGSAYTQVLDAMKDGNTMSDEFITQAVSYTFLDFGAWVEKNRLDPSAAGTNGLSVLTGTGSVMGQSTNDFGYASIDAHTWIKLRKICSEINKNNGVFKFSNEFLSVSENTGALLKDYIYNTGGSTPTLATKGEDGTISMEERRNVMGLLEKYMRGEKYDAAKFKDGSMVSIQKIKNYSDMLALSSDKYSFSQKAKRKVQNLQYESGYYKPDNPEENQQYSIVAENRFKEGGYGLQTEWAGLNMWNNGGMECVKKGAAPMSSFQCDVFNYTGDAPSKPVGFDVKEKAGLSTMAMFTYLTSSFDQSGINVYNGAPSVYTQNAHHSINLIGSNYIMQFAFFCNMIAIMLGYFFLAVIFVFKAVFDILFKGFQLMGHALLAAVGFYKSIGTTICMVINMIVQIFVAMIFFTFMVDLMFMMTSVFDNILCTLFENLSGLSMSGIGDQGANPTYIFAAETLTIVSSFLCTFVIVFFVSFAIRWRSVILNSVNSMVERLVGTLLGVELAGASEGYMPGMAAGALNDTLNVGKTAAAVGGGVALVNEGVDALNDISSSAGEIFGVSGVDGVDGTDGGSGTNGDILTSKPDNMTDAEWKEYQETHGMSATSEAATKAEAEELLGNPSLGAEGGEGGAGGAGGTGKQGGWSGFWQDVGGKAYDATHPQDENAPPAKPEGVTNENYAKMLKDAGYSDEQIAAAMDKYGDKSGSEGSTFKDSTFTDSTFTDSDSKDGKTDESDEKAPAGEYDENGNLIMTRAHGGSGGKFGGKNGKGDTGDTGDGAIADSAEAAESEAGSGASGDATSTTGKAGKAPVESSVTETEDGTTLWTQRNPETGTTTNAKFDAARGLVLETVDDEGNVSDVAVGMNGLSVASTDENGNKQVTNINKDGMTSNYDGVDGTTETVEASFDGADSNVTVTRTDADGNTEQTVTDLNGTVHSKTETATDGSTRTVTTDDDGNQTITENNATTGYSSVETISADGTSTKTESVNGVTTVTNTDAEGEIVSSHQEKVGANGSVMTSDFTVDEEGNQVTTVTANGVTTQTTTDTNGNVTEVQSVRRSDGSVVQTTTEYGTDGIQDSQSSKVVAANGVDVIATGTTTTGTDETGTYTMSSFTNADGSTLEMKDYGGGQIVATETKGGVTTVTASNGKGDYTITETDSATGNTSVTTLDDNGGKTVTMDASGNTIETQRIKADSSGTVTYTSMSGSSVTLSEVGEGAETENVAAVNFATGGQVVSSSNGKTGSYTVTATDVMGTQTVETKNGATGVITTDINHANGSISNETVAANGDYSYNVQFAGGGSQEVVRTGEGDVATDVVSRTDAMGGNVTTTSVGGRMVRVAAMTAGSSSYVQTLGENGDVQIQQTLENGAVVKGVEKANGDYSYQTVNLDGSGSVESSVGGAVTSKNISLTGVETSAFRSGSVSQESVAFAGVTMAAVANAATGQMSQVFTTSSGQKYTYSVDPETGTKQVVELTDDNYMSTAQTNNGETVEIVRNANGSSAVRSTNSAGNVQMVYMDANGKYVDAPQGADTLNVAMMNGMNGFAGNAPQAVFINPAVDATYGGSNGGAAGALNFTPNIANTAIPDAASVNIAPGVTDVSGVNIAPGVAGMAGVTGVGAAAAASTIFVTPAAEPLYSGSANGATNINATADMSANTDANTNTDASMLGAAGLMGAAGAMETASERITATISASSGRKKKRTNSLLNKLYKNFVKAEDGDEDDETEVNVEETATEASKKKREVKGATSGVYGEDPFRRGGSTTNRK